MLLDDIKKIAIITKSGLYDWNVMPFRLKNATRTFFRTIAKMFKDWTDQFLKVFVDDVNIHNQTWQERLTHLKVVFTQLQKVNLKLNLGECFFGAQHIVFLGHIVTNKAHIMIQRRYMLLKIFQYLGL